MMEPTTHMRLSGHAGAFPLTPAAQQRLVQYLADARAALAADPDGDETIRDIEAGIGDRLVELDAAGTPIDEAQMRAVLTEAGPVKVDVKVERTTTQRGAAGRGPFWCRIQEGKWFGGICLGIAARGGFRVDWVRTVVLLLALVTGGFLGLVYLVLLLFLPPVSSVEEYHRLRAAPREAAV